MKFINKLLSAFLSLFISSCATLALGPIAKVEIKPSTSGTSIKFQGIPVEKSASSSYLLSIPKKYKSPKLELSKEGYEAQSFTFRKTSRTGIKVLTIVGTIMGAGIIYAGYYLTHESSIQKDNDLGKNILPLGTALFLPNLIDICSRSANTYVHDSLNFDMIPIPSKATNKETETINCSSVNFKIQPGKTIGNVYKIRAGEFVKDKDNKWEETSNISYEELAVLTNEEFDRFGYVVPRIKDKYKEEPKSARYQVNAEVLSFEMTEYVYNDYKLSPNQDLNSKILRYESSVDRNCKQNIKWTIYDNKKGNVVFEKEIQTSVWGNNQSSKLLIFEGLSGSVKKLLCDPDFVNQVRKKNEEKIQVESSNETISITSISPPSNYSEAMQSAVTIDLGNSHGSGVIISKDGFVLTNYHVVEDEKEVRVILSNGVTIPAFVVRVDKVSDLALLRIAATGFKALAITTGEVLVGAEVVAIGTPNNIELGQSITRGIISGMREIEGNVLLQTDVSVSPGNSGGPLLNNKNEVVGIINSKMIGKGIEGIAFAIPIKRALDKLGIEIKK